MNERLKELLPNPYIVDYQVPHDGRGFDLYDERKMIEYGHRIIRECVELTLDYKNDQHYQGWIEYRDLIKQHFGVEE
jgi:hypothetical protein